MIKVGVVGGSGYAGSNIIKLLENRDDVSIEIVTSESYVGKKVSSVIDVSLNLEFSQLDFDKLNSLDVVFLAVPHGEAKKLVPKLKCRVIDMSVDYRIKGVYGLPEVFSDKIKDAKLIGNPGCYATACILSVYPIKDLISNVVFDCVSGYSGGGKNAKEKYDIEENIIAYKLNDHFHVEEMENVLGLNVLFTPHVTSFFRGIMCTAHVFLKEDVKSEEIKKRFEEFYKGSLTKVVSDIPCTKDVMQSPYCHIGGFEKKGNCVVIISVIDNLLKGAASQAVENMNLMFGL